MPPRLLTLLGLIETALVNQGSTVVSTPPQRSVSFYKGIARMNFAEGGSMLLQNYTLADGQICVKAVFILADGTEAGTTSIYPKEHFDWLAAADKIAEGWMNCQPKPSAAAKVTTTTEPLTGVGQDVATSAAAG